MNFNKIVDFYGQYQTLLIGSLTIAVTFYPNTPKWVPDNSDRDKSARKRGLVGTYVKTTQTV